MAFVKLCIDVRPSPGCLKQNLASVRIVSFLSLAWLCAQAVRHGWIRTLAERLSPVVTIGRQGLVCFVGGTVVSIFADAGLHVATRTSHLLADWHIRLRGDVAEIAALLLLATVAIRVKQARTIRSVGRDAAAFMHEEIRDVTGLCLGVTPVAGTSSEL
jgi:hypothetical protein